MLRSLDDRWERLLISCIALMAVAGIVLCYAGNKLPFPFWSGMLILCGRYMLFGSVITLIFILAIRLIYHRIYRGVKYAFLHYHLTKQLKMELFDADVFVKRFFMGEAVAVLPRVKVSFSDRCLTGEVRIEKTIKDRSKLEDKDISCALGRYIVEQSFTSANGNWLVYDIFDSEYDRQLVYENCREYAADSAKAGTYELKIDSITTVGLHHSLICGQTGSGKSYGCNTLIYQMLCKKAHYNLYFADPKKSSMAVIGNKFAGDRTADTIDGIIDLVRLFHNTLEERKGKMESALKSSKKVDADFRDFGMEPHVLIFDEYLAFSLSLANYKKDIRDEVSKMLSDIVLMGRQCGFFLWLIMQSAPSTQIPTFIRDQLVFKVVLGNSDRSTYTVTFDAGADIPAGRFSAGYGVYTYAGMTEKPKIIAFPTIKDFDILAAVGEL